jgi:hypothetical protein
MTDFVAYSDESGTGGEQYTCIASVSFKHEKKEEIYSKLSDILSESSVTEFKWQKLKDAKYRCCSIKLLDYFWELIGHAEARLDAIVWDNQDSRHTVKNRDNPANFGRMFFHLHHAALKRRPRNSTWSLFPDEKLDIDWDTVSSCMTAVGERIDRFEFELSGEFFIDQYFKVEQFEQAESHVELPCQFADLFAGLALFSLNHYDKYKRWESQKIPSLGLFDEEVYKPTNREENRFEVLDYFNRGCKQRKLYVSLDSHRCLKTMKASSPINFWHYVPQHEKDKAPTKT